MYLLMLMKTGFTRHGGCGAARPLRQPVLAVRARRAERVRFVRRAGNGGRVPGRAAGFRKKIKETIRSWGAELVDIDDITAEGLLVNESELAEIVKKMKSEQVDGLFFPHCNFGTEDLVAKAAKALNKQNVLVFKSFVHFFVFSSCFTNFIVYFYIIFTSSFLC